MRNNIDLICSIAELSGLFEKKTNIGGFLQEAVELVASHMKADVCSVYLFDEREDLLVLRATRGLELSSVGKVTLKIGEGITGQALKELRTIRVSDASDSLYYKHIPGINEEKFHAFLAVPIQRGLTRIGVLVLQHHVKNYFSEIDAKALRAIASQLASTLENVELLIELHGSKKSVSPESDKKTLPRLIKGDCETGSIIIGKALQFGDRKEDFHAKADSNEQFFTIDDFNNSLEITEKQLEELQFNFETKYSDVASLIFSSHLLMLKDEDFSGTMKNQMEKGSDAATAIMNVVNHYVHIFSASDTARLQEKALDVKDLGYRLIQNLNRRQVETPDYSGSILIARELYPSELLRFTLQNTRAIIVGKGSTSAHNSILARSLELPLIVTAEESIFSINDDTEILIDGPQGNIYIHPESELIEKYRVVQERAGCEEAGDCEKPTISKDGHRISMLANINLLADLSLARIYGAEGVGLYRSEFPFIIRNQFPSEEEQYSVYQKILDEAPNNDVVLRTLDIGGDKNLPYISNDRIGNSFLGMRGIRFLLRNKEIFREQIRAMLRVSSSQALRIMLPMISSIDEFVKSKEIIFECSNELKSEGMRCSDNVEIGIMIELPSVVDVLPELSSMVDFFSIGTNDLIMYILSVDRNDETIADLYNPLHPSVLRTLKRITKSIADIEKVSVCGRDIENQYFLKFLLGLGIRKLSFVPQVLSSMKKLVRTFDLEECKQFSESLLCSSTIGDVEKQIAFIKSG